MSNTRTFVAVDVSEPVRRRVAELVSALGDGVDGVKWVAAENLHFTLQFLGDVDDAALGDICTKVGRAAADAKPFEIRVAGAGAFPRPARPRTLWLGVSDGAQAMIALQATITAALAGTDAHLDRRPFSPHLTIGRVRGRYQPGGPLVGRIADHSDFDVGALAVDDVVVYSSELQRGGPVYQVLSRARLGPHP